jgi:RNA polymerase sigma-70 factor (ECF subfamily)
VSTAQRAYLTVVPKEDDALLSDRELVSALLARDPRAAALVWRKHAPRIFGVVQRTMGPDVEAEDLTQDIFLRVFARLHTLKNPDALGHFVLSVALRVIKWQLRQRRVRRILRLAEDGHVPEVSVPGLDAEARQALRRFYCLLDTLPGDERSVFVLRHIEGMNLLEIAQTVGMSLATIKRRLHRATARVAELTRSDSALSAYTSSLSVRKGTADGD